MTTITSDRSEVSPKDLENWGGERLQRLAGKQHSSPINCAVQLITLKLRHYYPKMPYTGTSAALTEIGKIYKTSPKETFLKIIDQEKG